ncbi:hypothetical protein SPRI_1041 [Streptomyces pristinaespiralis]|uniref:Uncharacterized protein n=1 Tax=Streptomyces pristinaespiralis TaxID=38300 RepID=A0A0M4DBM3_STRPR|nr:hypothetical protein SPRI_1041 [Streptomyces pristinaespiralis]
MTGDHEPAAAWTRASTPVQDGECRPAAWDGPGPRALRTRGPGRARCEAGPQPSARGGPEGRADARSREGRAKAPVRGEAGAARLPAESDARPHTRSRPGRVPVQTGAEAGRPRAKVVVPGAGLGRGRPGRRADAPSRVRRAKAPVRRQARTNAGARPGSGPVQAATRAGRPGLPAQGGPGPECPTSSPASRAPSALPLRARARARDPASRAPSAQPFRARARPGTGPPRPPRPPRSARARAPGRDVSRARADRGGGRAAQRVWATRKWRPAFWSRVSSASPIATAGVTWPEVLGSVSSARHIAASASIFAVSS